MRLGESEIVATPPSAGRFRHSGRQSDSDEFGMSLVARKLAPTTRRSGRNQRAIHPQHCLASIGGDQPEQIVLIRTHDAYVDELPRFQAVLGAVLDLHQPIDFRGIGH